MMDVDKLLVKHGRRRGLSAMTIKTYKQKLHQFFERYDQDPKTIRKKQINDYLDEQLDRGLAGSTINVHLCALKFLYNDILGRRLLLRTRFSKRPKRLPTVLSREEVSRILESVKTEKHRLVLSIMYSAGLRLSEVIKLKKEDIDFAQNIGWVRGGKGNKDRMFIVARKLKPMLEAYIQENCETESSYIFKGRKRLWINHRTVQEIVRRACRDAGITKRVTPHTFRHSFATHLVEDNYNIEMVQRLLGHQSPDTTQVYIHTAIPRRIFVESPYDTL